MRLVNPGVQDGSITPAKLSFLNRFVLTGNTADVPSQTWFTPAVGGLFAILAYCVQTQVATTSGTLPRPQVNWTDNDTNTVGGIPIGNNQSTNLLNQNTLVGVAGTENMSCLLINAKAGTVIQIQTNGYASVGATPLGFAIHAFAMGPF